MAPPRAAAADHITPCAAPGEPGWGAVRGASTGRPASKGSLASVRRDEGAATSGRAAALDGAMDGWPACGSDAAAARTRLQEPASSFGAALSAEQPAVAERIVAAGWVQRPWCHHHVDQLLLRFELSYWTVATAAAGLA